MTFCQLGISSPEPLEKKFFQSTPDFLPLRQRFCFPVLEKRSSLPLFSFPHPHFPAQIFRLFSPSLTFLPLTSLPSMRQNGTPHRVSSRSQELTICHPTIMTKKVCIRTCACEGNGSKVIPPPSRENSTQRAQKNNFITFHF